MTRITRIAPTDETSLKALRLLPKTWMRKNPPLMMVVRDEHIVTDVERATTPEDTIPMMIIGESGNVCVVLASRTHHTEDISGPHRGCWPPVMFPGVSGHGNQEIYKVQINEP